MFPLGNVAHLGMPMETSVKVAIVTGIIGLIGVILSTIIPHLLVIQTQPDDPISADPNFWIVKATTLNSENKYDEAIKALDEATKLDPANDDAWDKKGWNYFMLHDYNTAIECFDKAIILDSNQYMYWLHKGLALEALDRHNDALQALNKSIELDPHLSGWAWQTKRDIYLRLGNYQEANYSNAKAKELGW